MPKETYKKLVKKRIKECSFDYLIEKRNGKGIRNNYTHLEMQNYLYSEDINIQNQERKLMFQIRRQIVFEIKTHFQNMYRDTIFEGCRIEKSTSEHTLNCKNLIGPTYEDIYREDEHGQMYIARILKDNLGRLPAY